VTKKSQEKQYKKESRVSAGFRRLSLTFGRDFKADKAKRREEYEKDMIRVGNGKPEPVKDKKRNNMKQKVTETVRRLSVSMGVPNKKKSK
jgi:hypothetical protein